ncbi:unnamed protein product [Musa acuminata subsp. malaccensis]|uniref:(wild Malaysian banana) hypothetical protein n=1 Tax=Musa acuminata subsp. malaccensis TaxID=214687 RepID=A0A804JGS6_MUSAM|nr:unnamed protein product [Musa acuminata subsp. malaccensis]
MAWVLLSFGEEGKSEQKEKAAPLGGGSGEAQVVVSERGAQVFTYKQLHSATGGFGKRSVVGHGSAARWVEGRRQADGPTREARGGRVQDGGLLLVPVLSTVSPDLHVELLTRLHSPYLLILIGHCSDGGQRLLVYEFMANGGLQEHLYPTKGSYGGISKVDWDTRMQIALEAAKGLQYLHAHVNPPIIHRDFKSSNILLDIYFHSKVSDFGIAKLGSDKAGGHVSTNVLGTQGYVAPEYRQSLHLF